MNESQKCNAKEARQKEYLLWFLLYEILEQEKLIWSERGKTECGGGLTTNGHGGTFQGDGDVLYLDCDGGSYTVVYKLTQLYS